MEMMAKALCLEVAALCQDIWASCIRKEVHTRDCQVAHQEEKEDCQWEVAGIKTWVPRHQSVIHQPLQMEV